LEVGCSAIIQKSLPQKSRDPESFTFPVTIGNLTVEKALLDLGTSIRCLYHAEENWRCRSETNKNGFAVG